MRWYIYYKSFDIAESLGHPLLGIVDAPTQDWAERLAAGMGGGNAVMATTTQLLPGERIDWRGEK